MANLVFGLKERPNYHVWPCIRAKREAGLFKVDHLSRHLGILVKENFELRAFTFGCPKEYQAIIREEQM